MLVENTDVTLPVFDSSEAVVILDSVNVGLRFRLSFFRFAPGIRTMEERDFRSQAPKGSYLNRLRLKNKSSKAYTA